MDGTHLQPLRLLITALGSYFFKLITAFTQNATTKVGNGRKIEFGETPGFGTCLCATGSRDYFSFHFNKDGLVAEFGVSPFTKLSDSMEPPSKTTGR